MAKLFFSCSGEGRGHATRIRAVADALRPHHQITIFAPGDAWDLLAPAFEGTDVRVRRIPCLRFFYDDRHRLAFGKTGYAATRYLVRFPRLLRKLEAIFRREQPDLVVTDFEPSLPRAARRCGVPFVSFDHQHFLIANDLSSLPRKLQRYAAMMGLIVRVYYWGQIKTIVSSFYAPPLRKGYEDVVQVGVILRPCVVAAPRAEGEHLTVYLRKFAPEHVLQALRDCGRPARIYGLGERPPDGNLAFCAISEEQFLADLGTGAALVCTAGNQLVGEALYLGKPVLAFPEPNNQEQYINAHFLQQEGTGEWCEWDDLTGERLADFLERLPRYKEAINPNRYNGTPLALEALNAVISRISSGTGDC